MRMCIDLRKVNACTERDVYPLPNIDDLLTALQGATYFSALDLNSGYWPLYVDPKDRGKTAFVKQDGLYEFIRMSLGLTNAPATFQRAMDVVLAGLTYNQCLVYLDDVIAFGTNFREHNQWLINVLQALRHANLTVKAQKCIFGVQRMLFLGHVVDSRGIRTE